MTSNKEKNKKTIRRKSKAIARPIEERTTIQWGLFRRQADGHSTYVNSMESDCLLSGNIFEDTSPVTALENAFSSIAQVISELKLERGTEVRVSVRKK